MKAKLPVTSGKPFDMETDWEKEESRFFPVFLTNFQIVHLFSHPGSPQETCPCVLWLLTVSRSIYIDVPSTPFVHITTITGLLHCQDVKSVKHRQYTTTFSIITAHKHSGFESTHCFYLKTKADCFRNVLSVCSDNGVRPGAYW